MPSLPQFPQLRIIDHPLVQHKLSLMRDRTTASGPFRQLLREITLLIGYEMTRDLLLETRSLETPVARMDSAFLAGKKPVIVPILRAGLGMSDGLLDLMPSARIGHIGVFRGEDLQPREYFVKLPDLAGRPIFVCDPMLATGHSAAHALSVLVQRGALARDIYLLALVAAPEGMMFLQSRHPAVKTFVAALDERLNEHAYIVPGLGDAGDRLFGTKG